LAGLFFAGFAGFGFMRAQAALIACASARHQNEALERCCRPCFQPWVGGNQLLRSLHELDIQDKHAALIVTMGRVQVATIIKKTRRGPVRHLTLKDLAYFFPRDSIFAGLEVIDTLKQLVKMVDGILEAFASLVAARPA
jgi:hypothetical protein